MLCRFFCPFASPIIALWRSYFPNISNEPDHPVLLHTNQASLFPENHAKDKPDTNTDGCPVWFSSSLPQLQHTIRVVIVQVEAKLVFDVNSL